jgi:lipoprotein-anchoring transpeptidase ErfK/SrfK
MALAACSDGGSNEKGASGAAADASAGASQSVAASADANQPPTPALPPNAAAMSGPQAAGDAGAPVGSAPTGAAAATPAAQPAPPPPPATTDPRAVAINSAGPTTKARAGAWSPALVRAQVLLGRARFSPGVIDGREGDNFHRALAAFETAHGETADGRLHADVWSALTSADSAPVVTSYVITAADVAGPFSPAVPEDDLVALSKLKRVGYTSAQEMLAERFHMDKGLLEALNPGADFGAAGTRILVASFPAQAPAMQVRTIEVDKTARQVRAFDGGGKLLATYPATVGSTERPAPSGEFKVKGVAHDPTYTYDPKRLTYGDKALGKVVVPPGPNNPVGVIWIALNIPTYGIHGAPDPTLVGKTASHGCVRLTNWDIEDLASGVKPGVKVVFVGSAAAAKGAGKSARRARG